MTDTTNYRFAVFAVATELAPRCTGLDHAAVIELVDAETDDHLIGAYPGEWPDAYYVLDEPGYAHGCGPERLAALTQVRGWVVEDVVQAVAEIGQ